MDVTSPEIDSGIASGASFDILIRSARSDSLSLKSSLDLRKIAWLFRLRVVDKRRLWYSPCRCNGAIDETCGRDIEVLRDTETLDVIEPLRPPTEGLSVGSSASWRRA